MGFSAQEIIDSLIADRSKENVSHWVKKVHQQQFCLKNLFPILENIPNKDAWKVTWMLSHYAEQYPSKAANLQDHVWSIYQEREHEGMHRDCWRFFSFISISEELSGTVYNEAIQVITSANQPIAVRAHAMLAAYNIAQPYQELKQELTTVLLSLRNEESAGIRSRSKNLLKLLSK